MPAIVLKSEDFPEPDGPVTSVLAPCDRATAQSDPRNGRPTRNFHGRMSQRNIAHAPILPVAPEAATLAMRLPHRRVEAHDAVERCLEGGEARIEIDEDGKTVLNLREGVGCALEAAKVGRAAEIGRCKQHVGKDHRKLPD